MEVSRDQGPQDFDPAPRGGSALTMESHLLYTHVGQKQKPTEVLRKPHNLREITWS